MRKGIPLVVGQVEGMRGGRWGALYNPSGGRLWLRWGIEAWKREDEAPGRGGFFVWAGFHLTPDLAEVRSTLRS